MASKVILIRIPPEMEGRLKQDRLELLLRRGIEALSGVGWKKFVRRVFGTSARVGLKVNCLGAPGIPTNPSVAYAFASLLISAGLSEEKVIIWDRQNRELKSGGYRLNYASSGFRCYGTDTLGVGYERELLIHGEVGSLPSKILTKHCDLQVSLPVLKDHLLAGYTGSMKNFFGAIHNPNKYHMDGCRPFVTDLFSAPEVRNRVVFTVLDGTYVQYNGGPSFDPRWKSWEGVILLSLDPVAVDYVGYEILEKLRKRNGLPSLKDEKRYPAYIFDAASPDYDLGCAGEEEVVVEEVTGA